MKEWKLSDENMKENNHEILLKLLQKLGNYF